MPYNVFTGLWHDRICCCRNSWLQYFKAEEVCFSRTPGSKHACKNCSCGKWLLPASRLLWGALAPWSSYNERYSLMSLTVVLHLITKASIPSIPTCISRCVAKIIYLKKSGQLTIWNGESVILHALC